MYSNNEKHQEPTHTHLFSLASLDEECGGGAGFGCWQRSKKEEEGRSSYRPAQPFLAAENTLASYAVQYSTVQYTHDASNNKIIRTSNSKK